MLYDLAFDAGGRTPYWVKGGSLAGNEFHETAQSKENWEVLGHINGNALYTLSDPAFTDFVRYTAMMHPPVPDSYPFDVALWAVIANFPYSWPLWQRYLHLFVRTNFMTNLGFAGPSDLSHQFSTFVHSSLHLRGDEDSPVETESMARTSACPSTACGSSSLTGATCDETCLSGPDQRWGGYGCNANGLGEECRACFTDLAEALEADQNAAKNGGRAIMCDTRMPPVHPSCPHSCGLFSSSENGRLSLLHGVKGTICDMSCSAVGNSTSAFQHGCGAAGLGQNCRFCHTDEDDALMAMYGRGSSVMCGTLQAPSGAFGVEEQMHGRRLGRAEPGHRQLASFRKTCNPECPKRWANGATGRVCDPSCNPKNKAPYCNHHNKGLQCRMCYTSITKARFDMNNGATVIMCDTLKPPSPYGRRLTGTRRRRLQESDVTKKLQNHNGASKSICVFTRAYLDHMPYLDISIESARKFMPGSDVVVAVEEADLGAWQQDMERWTKESSSPGSGGGGAVRFVPLGGSRHKYSELWADEHCGASASLIYYLPAATVFTRTPLSLDLFRVSGELLVSHLDYERLGPKPLHWRAHNLQLLGVPAPSFTHGLDVLLPSSLSAQLRAALTASFGNGFMSELEHFGDNFNAVELLGAFAYSSSPPGLFFQDPASWGRVHAGTDIDSIWEVPLLKPPYTCRGDMMMAEARGPELAAALRDAFLGTDPCHYGWSVLEDTESLAADTW
ncbi:unnamed protein product [Phaeothamnion confervicola]